MPYAIVTNEPAKVACGAPDYIITEKKTGLPIAFFEAKDIEDSDLDGRKTHKEQFTRYKNSLDTIVFTDYLDFHLYEFGEWVENVRIAEIRGDKIVLIKENEAKFLELISHVGNAHPQKITSASKLAAIMASKARLLAETIKKSFSEENNSYDNRQLQGQYEAFKKVLIKGLLSLLMLALSIGLYYLILHTVMAITGIQLNTESYNSITNADIIIGGTVQNYGSVINNALISADISKCFFIDYIKRSTVFMSQVD